MLDNKQSMAIDTAVDRGKFTVNCPSATGAIISREVVQPGKARGHMEPARRIIQPA